MVAADLLQTGDGAAVRQLLDAGAAAVREPRELVPGERGAFMAVAPEGYQLLVQPYDIPGDRPRRRTGTVKLQDVRSFAAYWSKHREADSEIYAHVDDAGRGAITAIINAPGRTDDEAGHRDHRAVLDLAASPEWTHWLSLNGKLLDQTAFAEHIEQGLPNIIQPAAADMLEVAQSLTGNTRVEFESGVRLSDGQTRLSYRETTEAQTKGGLDIPSQFVIRVRPWKATVLGVELVARFRYRIDHGHVLMGYVLAEVDRLLQAATDALLEEVGEALVAPGDEGVSAVVILRGHPDGR
jgi:uncharacterized protein YfdQ (DUF2303 family)